MLAVAGRPPDHAGWAIEMKWDGVRAIVICETGGCRFYSRNRREITGSYPELAATLTELADGRELILDGEIIAQTPDGAPSFGLLQRRMHVVRPSKQLIAAVPVQLFLFDILTDSGDSLTALPYLERRDRLRALEFTAAPVQTPPHWIGVDPEQLMTAARDNHLEGIVSKRVDSTYQPGRRSPAWIKTPLRKTTEAIVVGWTTGNGAMSTTFGSLILAAHDHGRKLVYIGNVGTGFTAAARRSLRAQLDEIARPDSVLTETPGRGRAGIGVAHWVDPVLVGDIEYREYTGDGLRHPSWRGLRNDKTPAEITLPT
ncbi:non-homologous end-joining DNA ligase [Nocardia cyriacigeorgica]|uniref:DNA ligase (ATP) n=1 Tax=Nocardia cyriacigeorgica TaxID=135487 RepID=A0A6P1DEU5_9NOCA|nr:non-homologous end-joining DNA ligase [Nocardia cyriacigeorgica]NEW42503.1 ATP-dependent DNA ligase [Nocardia cyriacigeorgica]NEW48201.1 ATP-dependent DNA ligase [Nocardia cyriacigeorgica]